MAVPDIFFKQNTLSSQHFLIHYLLIIVNLVKMFVNLFQLNKGRCRHGVHPAACLWSPHGSTGWLVPPSVPAPSTTFAWLESNREVVTDMWSQLCTDPICQCILHACVYPDPSPPHHESLCPRWLFRQQLDTGRQPPPRSRPKVNAPACDADGSSVLRPSAPLGSLFFSCPCKMIPSYALLRIIYLFAIWASWCPVVN